MSVPVQTVTELAGNVERVIEIHRAIRMNGGPVSTQLARRRQADAYGLGARAGGAAACRFMEELLESGEEPGGLLESVRLARLELEGFEGL